MNSDPVQDYILEDENKLSIAVAVSDAWSKAGEKLVSGFLDRLRSRLEEKLKGWEFDRGGCYLNDTDATFNFWKPEWKGEYYVSLEIQNNGEDVTFGLGRDGGQEHVKNRKYCNELLAAVRERYPSASASKWWEATVTLQSPAAHWQESKVLWQMHTDRKFLEDVADQLLGVAEISERIVDRFVDQFARKK